MNINDFKAYFTEHAARTSHFLVDVMHANMSDVSMMAKGTSIPESKIGEIELNFQGRKIYKPGDREFGGTWDVTFYNDQDHTHYKEFENWINQINDPLANNTVLGSVETRGTAQVRPIKRDGSIGHITYKFHNLYPQSISAIDVDWGDNNKIQEYTVTFAYDYWDII